MRKHTKLLVVAFLIECGVAVSLLAAILFSVRVFAPESARAVSLVDSQEAGNVNLLEPLSADESSWSVRLADRLDVLLSEYADKEAEQERLSQAMQDKQEAFMLYMQEVAEQQEALQQKLDQQSEQAIAAMGGVGATKEDEVAIDAQVPSSTVIEDTEEYFGQFSAKIVCTCGSCFNSSDWPGVNQGDTFIWADLEFLPEGLHVKLDQGLGDDYIVKDSKGRVSGRSVILFSSNHSITRGGMQLYPKIYRGE